MIAALEAAIPDAAALVFASLGIALALHGKRAIRARVLNVGAVATSVFMNCAAAAPGWRGLAIWVMPPIAYALASDTAIGVIRAWTIARARELREDLADDDATPLAILGGLLRWVLRLACAAVVHPGRVPPVGGRGMPSRSRPYSRGTGRQTWPRCPLPRRRVARPRPRRGGPGAVMAAATGAGPGGTGTR